MVAAGESDAKPVEALVVAVPETAGSALYGMVDVLAATGNIWETLTGQGDVRRPIRPRIVAECREPFRCGNGIPVAPDLAVAEDPAADIVILPELWLGPEENCRDRYPAVADWVRRRYAAGAHVYSACSGAIMLAATGLLDGRPATSHWGYADLFRRDYPGVRFDPAPNLMVADPAGRIVTAGGTTSWHDLALHIIARHCSPGDALRIAQVYLLKWHAEGQLPYAALVRRQPHADSAVRACEAWLAEHFHEAEPVAGAVRAVGIPERTLKRRFRAATGSTIMARVQALRVEAAKRLLEEGTLPVDAVAAEVGYEEPAFFRRLFRRLTGLTPGDYRRMFRPVAAAGALPPASAVSQSTKTLTSAARSPAGSTAQT